MTLRSKNLGAPRAFPDFPNSGPNFFDVSACFLSGMFNLGCKLAHFARDYSETSAVLLCVGSFNRRVKGKEIRLRSDVFDGSHDFTNGIGLMFQLK
ncbi:hypothetical protein D3C86_1959320 [compost metagenome]